ncbi:MAG: PP2C family protein-serine/threonine phosphatase, partial [bacterium]
LITVLLKSTFSAFNECETSPAEILSNMNKVLNKILPKTLFVAAMVVTIDVKKAQCRIVNGGIPHPYLLRSHKQLVERIPANGLLLGVANEELYTPGEEITVHLQKGDRLILFTDGLSETENESAEHFETTLLMQTLTKIAHKTSTEILEDLTRAAKSFSKPEHNWDDITILGIETN